MGTLSLPAAGTVYFDANAVIYSVEKIEPYRALLDAAWKASEVGAIRIVGSELLLLECLVKPVRAADSLLEHTYRELLLGSGDVRLMPVDLPVIERAIRIRAENRLKTPDAIHAASALQAGAALFVTNDARFRRVEQLPVVLLSELVTH